ncbi:group III truncated hemoglobin [Novosphingobium nitrogenifigens]|nr:group III truncated hemoglobin [Novosphingobium nitrogenifigens]
MAEPMHDHDRPERTELVDEETLVEVVGRFYARVRRDPLLGPVFNHAISDWNRHLHRLVAFWSSVINGSGRYRGDPMAAHIAHADTITPDMFERWLALWKETTEAVLEPSLASLFQQRAERMATAITRAIRPSI